MSATVDPRFARLQTDPRFRKPRQKQLQIEIDERFRDVLESEEYGGKGKGKGTGKAGVAVDKRGRPMTGTHHADQLKRFYRLRSLSPGPSSKADGFVDYARGEGALASSGSEDEGGEDDESEVEEEELQLGQANRRYPQYEADDDSDESGSEESHLDIDLSEEEGPAGTLPVADEENGEEQESAEPTKRIAAVNLDWDNLRAADLFSVFNSFLQQSMGSRLGESSSSVGRLLHVKIYPSEFGKSRLEKEEVEGPGGGLFVGKAVRSQKKAKRREEIVLHEDVEAEDEVAYNDIDDGLMDGEDHAEGEDTTSEVGSGDAKGASKGSVDDSEADEAVAEALSDGEDLEILSDAGSAADDEIDMKQLRQYQLERLRYYYAIATFSTVAAAKRVMNDCNGTEFERTANMLDLSFVPEDMGFTEEDVTDTATKELKGYKGNDFVTDVSSNYVFGLSRLMKRLQALRHSKVKLTWDQDDPNRIKVTRRNMTRDEIEEQDFKAYVASSDSEDVDEGDLDVEQPTAVVKKAKKQAVKDRTAKLRSLLLSGGNDEDGDIWGKAGTSMPELMGDAKGKKGNSKADKEMEITFRPGLSVSETPDADEENMTTLERYQMRLKEKKARKKEKAELKRATKDDGANAGEEGEDDFFGDSDPEGGPSAGPGRPNGKGGGKVELHGEDQDEREADGGQTDPQGDRSVGRKAQAVEHFSMKDILRAEKTEGQKGRRKRPGQAKKEAELAAKGREREIELGPQGWKVDVRDERFKALHTEPEFAIDPSNPRFTKTQAMTALLAERSKVRNKEGPREGTLRRHPDVAGGKEKDLGALVESVKRKMERVSDGRKVKKRSRK